MKHDIRLIAIDIDGTLVDGEKRVSPRTAAAVRKAAEKGIIMCLATGRPMHGLPEDVEKLNAFRYGIFSGGAVIADIPESRPVYRKPVPLKQGIRIMELLMSFPVTAPEVYFDGEIYVQQDRVTIDRLEFSLSYSSRTKKNVVPDIIEFMKDRQDDPEKLYCLFKHQADKKRAEEELNAMGGLEVVESLQQNLEISVKGADKGSAFTELLRQLGIKKKETMVIGDSENDRSIMEASGYIVAMGNARNSIRVIADEITDPNEKDGVAVTLERLTDELEKLGR
ncbi:MAG: HAD family phosphatase [Lachnospiraceae bacterium]|nr:HAD family phosphatase [Lachnospiraceae bacterium]